MTGVQSSAVTDSVMFPKGVFSRYQVSTSIGVASPIVCRPLYWASPKKKMHLSFMIFFFVAVPLLLLTVLLMLAQLSMHI